MCALRRPSHSTRSTRETFAWPNFERLALSLRRKAGLSWGVGGERQALPAKGVSQHRGQGPVAWPARSSSLGIRHPPGQREDTEA